MTKLSAEDRLRRRREQLGLSRKAAAELTGLKVSRIWASEKTDVKVDTETRKKITEAYNRKAAEIGSLPPIE